MIVFKKYILILILSLVIAQYSLADVCGRSIAPKSGVSYDWCIDQSDRQNNPDILFYFHGIMSSEASWQSIADHKTMRSHWKNRGFEAPTVISISFGRKWLLTEVESSDQLFYVFKDEVISELEQKVGGLNNGRRLLMGRSMGGFNASQMLLKTNLFQKVALICPAFTRIGPNASALEIEKYIQRTQASRAKIYTVIQLNKKEFPTEQDWQKHSPLALVQNHVLNYQTEVLISCGEQDEYGFYEGYQDFINLAVKQNLNLVSYSVPGPHCSFDPIRTAEFLVQK